MKETPTQKLKRELLEVRQQLFEVCNNPNSDKSRSIIFQQKAIYAHSKNAKPFYDQLKSLGFGKPKDNPFNYFESL